MHLPRGWVLQCGARLEPKRRQEPHLKLEEKLTAFLVKISILSFQNDEMVYAD
jgi:hypothetical protein